LAWPPSNALAWLLAVARDIDTGTKEIVGTSEGVFAPLGNYGALVSGVQQAIAMHSRNFAASTARIRQEFGQTAMWARYASAFGSILATPPATRVRAGQTPPLYRPPVRLYQLLPSRLRAAIRNGGRPFASHRLCTPGFSRQMSEAKPARGFLVLAANTPWVYALAQCLADHAPVTIAA
jgi:hypothetical protein